MTNLDSSVVVNIYLNRMNSNCCTCVCFHLISVAISDLFFLFERYLTETCGEGMTGNIEKRIVEGEQCLRLYHCACVLLVIIEVIVVKDPSIMKKNLLRR